MTRATKPANILDCLEAAYRLDLDGTAYVQNLVDAAVPLLDRGIGVLGYTYDASDPKNPVIDHSATSSRFEQRWLHQFYAEVAAAGLQSEDTPTGFHSWGHMTVGQATAVPQMRTFLPYFAIIGGARDAFAMNALDASGHGLWLGAPMRSTRKVSNEQFRLFGRLAAHLSAALRVRRVAGRSKPKAAAVLAPDGALLHAEREDESIVASRGELRRATLAFDQARTKKMRADVEMATRRWRPLVTSRWSLLDDFDTDGRRFVIAVENAPPTRAPRRDLSERELQVMTQAHLGHSDKVIAYELGLSNSTVRVLLHRAIHKLGATTRREAIARFEALLETPEKPKT